MARPTVSQFQRLGVEQAIAACGELIAGKLLCRHAHVQVFNNICRRKYTVVAIDCMSHDKGLLEKYSQQCSGESVTDCVSYVKADMPFIDANSVVNIPRYPLGRLEHRRPFYLVGIRQLSR